MYNENVKIFNISTNAVRQLCWFVWAKYTSNEQENFHLWFNSPQHSHFYNNQQYLILDVFSIQKQNGGFGGIWILSVGVYLI